MRKIQSQGVHHITLTGANRQTSIAFWEGLLGMPFVFEQPNLDNADESHLYFDPGDGRLITVFTNEERVGDPGRTPMDPGCVHHLAFAISQATFAQTVERLGRRALPRPRHDCGRGGDEHADDAHDAPGDVDAQRVLHGRSPVRVRNVLTCSEACARSSRRAFTTSR